MIEEFLKWMHPEAANHLREYLDELEARITALEGKSAEKAASEPLNPPV